MFNFLIKLGRDESGATAVEYGLILAMVFLAMIGALQTFGTEAIALWELIADKVTKD